jgi:molybdopterin-binding protein
MAEAAALTVAVAHRFSGGFAIDVRLDAQLAPGSMLVLFGPSGAGKTTILRHLAGLERPDEGIIRFDGSVWCDTVRGVWQPPQSRRIGLVFQNPTLFPHLTVRDNVRFGTRSASARDPVRARSASAGDRVGARSAPGADLVGARSTPGADRVGARSTGGAHRVAEIEAMLGIGELGNRYPRSLSGGEAQRVALARALAPDPGLLLLDEPFASLDAPARLRLRRELRVLLHATGTPAILVTHDRSEALAIGDMVAVIIGGRVRQVGPVNEAFSRPADADVAASLGIEAVLPARVAGSTDGVIAVSLGEVTLHAAEREPIAPGVAVYACVRAEDVTLEAGAPVQASTRNHLAARIVSIASEGPLERVSLDCGFPLDALITRRSREEMHLAAGAHVTAAIKATSVHLVPRD